MRQSYSVSIDTYAFAYRNPRNDDVAPDFYMDQVAGLKQTADDDAKQGNWCKRSPQ